MLNLLLMLGLTSHGPWMIVRPPRIMRVFRLHADPGLSPGTFWCMVSRSGILYRPGTSHNSFETLTQCFPRVPSGSSTRTTRFPSQKQSTPTANDHDLVRRSERCSRCSGPLGLWTLAVTAWGRPQAAKMLRGWLRIALKVCARSVSFVTLRAFSDLVSPRSSQTLIASDANGSPGRSKR
ncbi:hypothetical protein DFP72DRAFT_115701 [Ephemerocybe angulata]|uniref:Uncharacterized protein n=1 Tax=Ephemerocybe angulata TaxID=980116 RepID=A0A8H6MC61_9AGAR|nr:hypothetical protein DFP72DRAFT_115701 [Tulosesus angulatus]